jgi:hypothetical protein
VEDREDILRRIPDLSQLLRDAPSDVKRQVFDAFGLQITYDKTANKFWLNATITEQLAATLEQVEDLAVAPVEGGAAANQEAIRLMSVRRARPRLTAITTRKSRTQPQGAP